jgi:sugar phosphate permease
MKKSLFIVGLFLVTPVMLSTAQAQGVPGGAAHGFYEGNRIAGPVGAVVGTAVGGAIGGVEGVLGLDHRYYARETPVVYRHHWRHRHHHRHM